MIGRNARQNVIAAFGNYSVYPANQPIWSADGDCLVEPGRIVVFDPIKQKSLGAGITVATNPQIVIGVGHDVNGDGVSETIRACFGDKMYGNNLTAASAEPPACGVGAIKDFFFDCTHYNDDFTIAVTVENYRTQTEFADQKDATYVVGVKVDKAPCDTCDTGVACNVVACDIVNAFQGKAIGTNSPWVRDKFTQNALDRQWKDAPFKVVPLYGSANLGVNTTKEYCISTVASGCDNCIDTNFLFTTATYTDTSLDVPALHTLTFTNVVNTAGTATLSAQLDRIVSQINKDLNGNGYAVLRRGIGKCCSHVLEVNTCFDTFAITGLATCANYNPYNFTYVQQLYCKNCAVSSTVAPPKCGIRVIAQTEDYNCSCYPTTTPIVNFDTKIGIFPLGGFQDGQTYVKEIQAGSGPRGLGYHWQYIDYISDNGGLGRSQKDTTDFYGVLPLPGANSRLLGGGVISCASQYCSYSIHHNLPHRTTDVHGWEKQTQGLTSIIIKSSDTTTRTSFEAVLNPYITSAPIKIASITCASDQDQDNGTYPDYNGDRRI